MATPQLRRINEVVNIDGEVQRMEEYIALVKNHGVSHHVSDSFNSLIDRLERASNAKYLDRQWNAGFKQVMLKQWKGKEDELLKRVKKLEKELYYR